MSFRYVGSVAEEHNMLERAQADAWGFEGLLSESKDPGQEVRDFCAIIRKVSSLQNKWALERWGANSADYISMAGWMKFMVNWLERCQAFANLLDIRNGDQLYLRSAAQLMGLLHTFSQTISLALPEQQDEVT